MKISCMCCPKVFEGTPDEFARAGWWQMAGPLGVCPLDRERQDRAFANAKTAFLAARGADVKIKKGAV